MVKTYYFKRPDGVVFACEAEEADSAKNKFTYLGCSDGKIFYEMMAEGQKKRSAINAELKRQERRLDNMLEKIDELEMEDAPKKKISLLQKKIDAELVKREKLQEKLNKLVVEMTDKALKAEIKRAKKEPIPDSSFFFPMGNANVLAPYLKNRR